MKLHNGEPISPEMLEHVERLAAMEGQEIDLSEMPEATDWSNAVRGKYYRPVKKPYSLRLDEDVVAWFRSGGDGYQTRINAALREYMLSHGRKSA